MMGFRLPLWPRESAFGEEAMAVYHKFLQGEPLVEKEISMDHPQFRIQAKMKRVQAGVKLWRESGKDPSEVEKLMQSVQSLMTENKLEEVEEVLDKAIEMLGEKKALPDVYGQDKDAQKS